VRDIIRVVANTGMRNSELSSLTLSDIDFERKCLLAGEGRKSAHAKPSTTAEVYMQQIPESVRRTVDSIHKGAAQATPVRERARGLRASGKA
jgi:integrase